MTARRPARKPKPRNGTLGALVHPLTAETFLDRHWPSEPLVVHGPVERFGPWVRTIAHASGAIQSSHAGIRVWPPGERFRGYSGASVTADAAEQIQGTRDLTLSIDGVMSPAIDRFKARLSGELGTPAALSQC